MWTYFCFPSFREHKEQFPFFISLALFHIARLLSPLTSVFSPLVLNQKSCSCPSQVLFQALAHPRCHSLHGLQAPPAFSLCCTRTRPSSGKQLWLFTGATSSESHIVYLTGKGSFVHYCCQSFTPLPLCVQSFLPMCKTLCYLPCIALSFSFSKILPQIPHLLWILMQVSNSSPAVHADNLMSSTLFNKHGNPHRTSALSVHMMDGIYLMINHIMYCFPFLCSCGPYLLSPA